MHLHKLFLTLAASLSFVSCIAISTDENALPLLIGRDASELYLAFGKPKSASGGLNSGKMRWEGWDYVEPDSNSSDQYAPAGVTSYVVESHTQNGRIVALLYDANMDVISLAWRHRNAWLMDLNYACAANDLAKVQQLLAMYPSRAQPQLIAQATAQAIRYKAIDLASYLINTYKVDINETIETWRMTGDEYDFSVVLENTTISKLLQENAVVLKG